MFIVPDNVSSEGPLLGAVEWIGAVLLGPMATIVAVVAVASVGFFMLAGHLPARRAVSVIIGCFIIFSASGVAAGLLATTSGDSRGLTEAATTSHPAYTPMIPKPQAYDPYSGAAVPDRDSGDLLN